METLKVIERAYGTFVPATDPWYRGYVDDAAAKNLIPLEMAKFDQEMNRGQVADVIARSLKRQDGTQAQYLREAFGPAGTWAVTYADLKAD